MAIFVKTYLEQFFTVEFCDCGSIADQVFGDFAYIFDRDLSVYFSKKNGFEIDVVLVQPVHFPILYLGGLPFSNKEPSGGCADIAGPGKFPIADPIGQSCRQSGDDEKGDVGHPDPGLRFLERLWDADFPRHVSGCLEKKGGLPIFERRLLAAWLAVLFCVDFFAKIDDFFDPPAFIVGLFWRLALVVTILFAKFDSLKQGPNTIYLSVDHYLTRSSVYPNGPYPWLSSLKPTRRIGSSILVFEIEK
jgi:hypothetical protein